MHARYVFGIPLLGVAGLVLCLWHSQAAPPPLTDASEVVYLVQPNPLLNRSMTIFLRREAQNVAYSRRHDGPKMQAKAVADYNLIARECTPAVFQATHLPPMLVF